MEDSKNQIGRRVRKFRTAKGLTQNELELSIGASCGHISKIESGHINPTKETLVKISETLDLNLKEKLLLLDLHSETVTPQEVEEAINHVTDYFDNAGIPSYLADDFWFTWTGNRRMLELIGAPVEGIEREKFLKEIAGTHVLEWLFNYDLGVRKRFVKERWEDLAINQCVFFIGLVDYFYRQDQDWLEYLVDRLTRLEDFNFIWERSKKIAQRCLSRKELSVTYVFKGDWYEFFIANSRINTMPRFMIVEYIPCAIYRKGNLNDVVRINS